MANNMIALQALAPKINSPLEMATQRAQLEQLAVAQRQQQQAAADMATQRAALAADPSGGDGYLKSLAAAGNVQGYYAGRKANQERDKNAADVGETNAKAKKVQIEAINLRTERYKNALNTINDKDSAAALVKAMYDDPDIGATITQELGPLESSIKRIPDPAADPEGFAAWKRGTQIGAEKLAELGKKVIGSRSLGNRVENTATDPFTGKVTVTGSANIAQSPDSVASIAQQERNSRRVDERARDLAAATATAAKSDVYDPLRGVLINKGSGAARPVLGQDGKPLPRFEKPLTEFQGKSAGFADRAAEADAQLAAIGVYSPSAINTKQALGSVPGIGGMLEGGANMALSAANQKAEQAQRNFINAILRQESGAAISPSEFENARRQYFPQPGDKPENIAQKAKNRKTAIAGLGRSAGASYSPPTAEEAGLPEGWGVTVSEQ